MHGPCILNVLYFLCCMFLYILTVLYFLCCMFLYILTHSFSLELIVSLFTFNCFDVYHLTCTFLKSISTTVKESDSDTIIMVIVLVAGVGGVFILFALMALCYRLENEIHLCSYAIHVVNALIKNVV